MYPNDLSEEVNCDNPIKVEASVIDDYVKSLFNTSRTFMLETQNNKNYYLMKIGKGINAFLYDINTKTYYYGYLPSTGYESTIYTKLIKSEQEEGTIYIYDKAFVKSASVGVEFTSVIRTIEDNDEPFLIEYNGNSKAKYIDEDGNVNSEAIFTDFDSKINTFKHTFKKADDGKFYWYSSEIVNE